MKTDRHIGLIAPFRPNGPLIVAVLVAVLGIASPKTPQIAIIEGISFEQSAGGSRLLMRLHATSEIPWYSFQPPEGEGELQLTLLNTSLSDDATLETAEDPLASYEIVGNGSKVVLKGVLTRRDVSVNLKLDDSSYDLIIVISELPGIRMLAALADTSRSESAERSLPSQKINLAAPVPIPKTADRSGIPGFGTTSKAETTAGSASPVSDVERLFASALKKSEATPEAVVAVQPGNTRRWKLDTIVLDAGHGGWDEGAFGKAGFLEKDLALIIALRLGRMLEENLGVNVVYTRDEDRFVPVSERGRIANEAGGKLFLSIHANYSNSRQAHGTETYFLGVHRSDSARVVMDRENQVIQLEDDQAHYAQYDKAVAAQQALAQSSFMRHSEVLAEGIQQQFTDVVGRRDRGVKQAGFYVLFGASMPSVLIELGFLSNPSEEKFLSSTTGQTSMANAIFRAVQNFKIEYEKSLQVAVQ